MFLGIDLPIHSEVLILFEGSHWWAKGYESEMKVRHILCRMSVVRRVRISGDLG